MNEEKAWKIFLFSTDFVANRLGCCHQWCFVRGYRQTDEEGHNHHDVKRGDVICKWVEQVNNMLEAYSN